jgi:hypothetical protein
VTARGARRSSRWRWRSRWCSLARRRRADAALTWSSIAAHAGVAPRPASSATPAAWPPAPSARSPASAPICPTCRGPRPIEIRIVRDSAARGTPRREGRGAPRWAAGVAYPDVGVVVLALGRGGQRHDVDKTLDHELAHLALGAAVPGAPRWLHEGFAWQHAADLDAARIETLAGMAWFGSVIPLDELEYGFPAGRGACVARLRRELRLRRLPRPPRPLRRSRRRRRSLPFQDFLRELGHGKSLDEAARTAFGADHARAVRRVEGRPVAALLADPGHRLRDRAVAARRAPVDDRLVAPPAPRARHARAAGPPPRPPPTPPGSRCRRRRPRHRGASPIRARTPRATTIRRRAGSTEFHEVRRRRPPSAGPGPRRASHQDAKLPTRRPVRDRKDSQALVTLGGSRRARATKTKSLGGSKR